MNTGLRPATEIIPHYYNNFFDKGLESVEEVFVTPSGTDQLAISKNFVIEANKTFLQILEIDQDLGCSLFGDEVVTLPLTLGCETVSDHVEVLL